MRVGQVRKRDANEAAIVQTLRQAGALVIRVSQLGAPDLVVCFRSRITLLEVKGPRGHLTQAQQLTQQLGWPVLIVHTPADALDAVGIHYARSPA